MKQLRIGIAGLGTVGGGLLELLAQDRQNSPSQPIKITAVSARQKNRPRKVSILDYEWFDDPVQLAQSANIDVFVELIGGANGTANQAVIAALKAGKHVVTANKELLAKQGENFAILAEEKDLSICYSASVGGAVPMVRTLREAMAGTQINALSGTLNGTCNYILSQMALANISFAEALTQARDLGYAEADPRLDLNGSDTAHKLTILATLAFDVQVDLAAIPVTGIDNIDAEDVAAAKSLGYVIRLLGQARKTEAGLFLQVSPALVPASHVIGASKGPENILQIEASPIGCLTFAGVGAGAGPTASAVLADLISIARGNWAGPVFKVAAENLRTLPILSPNNITSPFFIRARLKAQTDVLANLTAQLALNDISVDRLEQKAGEGEIIAVLTTHPTTEENIRQSVAGITTQDFSLAAPSLIRIENFNG